MAGSRRVVVIGGGVIGLSAAVACAERGHSVTVLEPAPARRGASLGNAGMIVPSHFIPLAAPGMVALGLRWMWNPESPFYIKPRLNFDLAGWAFRFMRASTAARVKAAAPILRDLHLASREEYVRLAETESFGLEEKGLLMLCKTGEMLRHEAGTAEKARQLGVAAEVLDAAATAVLDPRVTMEVAGSVYYPKDCFLQPERFVAVLEKRLAAAGGVIRTGVQFSGCEWDGRRIRAARVLGGEEAGTEGGKVSEMEADEFVLAGGAWSSGLAKAFGHRIPMEAGKGYSLTLPRPVETPQICAILAEARVAVTPMGGALRFGGTMEIAGLNERVDPRRVAGIIKAIPQYYPRFQVEDFAGLQPWSGLRPCSPDGMPYLGRTAAAENVIVATGHGMMGLSLAPITGRIVGKMLEGEETGFDLRLLDPDRFA